MKNNSREHIASIAVGAVLFFFAAIFAIGILLKILDFGTGEEGGSLLYRLGGMLIGAYGLCGMLIPIFFAIAGAFCFDSRWSTTRAACLIVSVIPFMTLVFAEKIIRDVLSYDKSSVAFVKITMTSVVTLLLIAAEYLLAVILAGRLQIFLEKKRRGKPDKASKNQEDEIIFEDGNDLSDFYVEDEIDDDDFSMDETVDADSETFAGENAEEEDEDDGEFQAPQIASDFFGDEKKTVLVEKDGDEDEEDDVFQERTEDSTLKKKIGSAFSSLVGKIKARVQDMVDFSKKQDEEDKKEAEIQKQKEEKEIRETVDINEFFKKPAERVVLSNPDFEEDTRETRHVLVNDEPKGILDEQIYRRPENEESVKRPNPFESMDTPVEETFELETSTDSSMGDEIISQFEKGNLEYNEADFINPFATITEDDSIQIETSGTIGQDEIPLEMSDLQVNDLQVSDLQISDEDDNSDEEEADVEAADEIEEKIDEEPAPEPTFTPSKKRTPEEEEAIYARARESVSEKNKPEEKKKSAQVTVSVGDKLSDIFARIDADVKAELRQNSRNEEKRSIQEKIPAEKNDSKSESDVESAPVNFSAQGTLVDIDEPKPVQVQVKVELPESVQKDETSEAPKISGDRFSMDPLKDLHDFETNGRDEIKTDAAKVEPKQSTEPSEKKVRHGLLARTESFASGEKWTVEESHDEEPVRIEKNFSDDSEEIPDSISAEFDEDEENIVADIADEIVDDNIDDNGNDFDFDSSEREDEIDELDESGLNQETQNPSGREAVNEKPVVRSPVYVPKPVAPYNISTDLLKAYEDNPYWIIDQETQNAAQNLKQTLAEFKIEAEVTGIQKGPVVTMFEILPAPGVKLNRIVALQDNIALRLAASSVRIVAPIPGKHAVGIEVPNKSRAIISIRECLEQERPEWKKMGVPVVLGKDIQGNTQIMDLVKTPHLLIAGATGAGKSVCVNSIILSILFKRSPHECKMILIDPKIVELKLYNDIPHLLTPVITEPKKAMQALQYCLCEMERRYSLLDNMSVRDISSYNKKIVEKKMAAEHLPYLIVIIDEFADLMATTGKQLEGVVARLAAMSRAVGIHLVLATQRPSVDVITGLIKANIPSRIAFMVASKMDSRIILDYLGAEKLLGKGDMLYASATDPFPTRIQGTFVSDQEVENVVEAVKAWGEPEYIDDEIFVDDDDEDGDDSMSLFNPDGDDPLYEKALDIVVQAGKASASYIQRRLKIGYNRAARLVEEMEERGIVGPANGSKPRELIHIP